MIWVISYFTILSLSFWSLSWVIPDGAQLSEVPDYLKIVGCFIYTCLVHIWLLVSQTQIKEFRENSIIIGSGIIYFIITHIVGITVAVNLATFDITNIITLPIGIFLYLITFAMLNPTQQEKKEQSEMIKEELMTKQELKNWFLKKLDSLEESQSMVDYLERLEEIKEEVKKK